MNNKFIKLAVASTACALGFAVFANQSKAFKPVEAATHVENYNPYSYSGTYYDALNIAGTDGLNGTFRSALASYIFPKDWYKYGSLGDNNLSTVLQYADEDPTNSSNMIYLYTRDSVKKNNSISGTGNWNREHVWPQANSNSHWGTDNAGADLLHIRPTYERPNSDRGNKIYADTNKANLVKYNDMPFGYITGNYFEPLDSAKGDIARIIMYVWTTYYDYYQDTSLKITKTFSNYDTLLKWHTMDKPDVMEGNRNNYCEKSKQKNRNPFVDHPEYAWKIFGDQASSSVLEECKAAYPENGVKMTKITISGQPTKKSYVAGQTFDPTGLTVTATYDDGSNKVIANSNCSWEPKKLRAGQTSVTCSYNGFSATYEGITVEPAPTPTIKGTYGIIFKDNEEESTTPLTSNELLQTYTVDNTLVESISTVQNVYACENGLRVDIQGSIKFNLKNIAKTPNIESIYFVSKPCSKTVEVDVKLNEEEISFDSTDDTHIIHIAGYFDEGISIITITPKGAFQLIELGIYMKQSPQPGSSASESSSETTSSSEANTDNKKSTGCNGSIVGVASIVTMSSALMGLIFAFSKKKEK